MRIYDVSIPLRPEMITYPGDPPFERTLSEDMTRGASSDVAFLRLGAHSGTHVDAPSHMIPGAATLDDLPLDAFVGPAIVVAVDAESDIEPSHLAALESEIVVDPLLGTHEAADPSLAHPPRILLKTRNSTLWRTGTFAADFVHLTAASADYLVKRGVRLVGIDYLSVDRFHSGTHPAHLALMRAGVAIIEGLDLSAVPPGQYTLVCAPLRIHGGEAAPARVFLIA